MTESLPGRAGVYELLPMSLEEQIGAPKVSNEQMYDGLYPAVCAGKNIARLFYPSYVKTYLEKDVRDLLRIKDQMQFLKFLQNWHFMAENILLKIIIMILWEIETFYLKMK